MSRHKIVDYNTLPDVVDTYKKRGHTVVTTNGCFDILHVGHIRYLQEARKLGDVLIVAVNTDESVKLNKGPRRPLNTEQDRAEALAALECVDYVTLFSDKTPESLLSKLKPHIHTKGGDYVMSQIIEKGVVEAGGGKVVLISPTKGLSTTNLINKIVNIYRK